MTEGGNQRTLIVVTSRHLDHLYSYIRCTVCYSNPPCTKMKIFFDTQNYYCMQFVICYCSHLDLHSQSLTYIKTYEYEIWIKNVCHGTVSHSKLQILVIICRFTFRTTVCPKSFDQFCVVSYFIKWVKTSWTYSSSFNNFIIMIWWLS